MVSDSPAAVYCPASDLVHAAGLYVGQRGVQVADPASPQVSLHRHLPPQVTKALDGERHQRLAGHTRAGWQYDKHLYI